MTIKMTCACGAEFTGVSASADAFAEGRVGEQAKEWRELHRQCLRVHDGSVQVGIVEATQ